MAAHTPLDILAIAAHPDDIEITCGGFMIKMADLGRRTGALDLTRGEMGTHGTEHDRATEAAEAAEIMGLKYRENLYLQDSAVEFSRENRLKLAQVIRDTSPEMVVLPHWEQRHPDHLACSRLGYDACFLAGLKKASLSGQPHRPRKILYVSYFRNSDHSFFVDISDTFKRKVQAVAAYRSQFGDPAPILEAMEAGRNLFDLPESRKDIFHPGTSIFDLMQTRARQCGQVVNVRYAEAFTVKEQLLIDDPFAMAVRSI
ncbi:MAG: bacillithiol biosynthesis deacetylase BshB1 [candidate division Zixibacteria bacterium]|nr:bacillithiol biosynthesis deacetylase BshB1 [candidate division Zixibacteria bacterium]